MKFQLAVNLERVDDTLSMPDVAEHTLDMVKMADQGGFEIVWSAEHHALEMTIAPNPFQLLTWWAGHTQTIRLGTAVAVAPYWHPINLAGEAAMTDLISGGRLEFGIGSGAYQREFDRMFPGLKQSDGWRYMHEMLPVLKGLWAGDYEHKGEFWSFPSSTSVPKPLQLPHPPIWVAARAPITFDYAVEHGCNIMSWPLTRGFSEAELYKSRLDDALAKHPEAAKPVFAMMRHTAVYDDEAAAQAPIRAIQRVLGQFENLFKNLGDVTNGFPREIALDELQNREEFNADMLRENLMFGTPEQVIEKLKRYENLGVDSFIYYANMGLGMAEQKRSMELFCSEVMPAFS
ncbi:MAG: LLM class flavin-dependent oxidoreductase [Gammaproteobacteria bacterium]|nr:LLM class flavin-dependent oxidoreductase [Gammaproteobacteria bacterium]